MKKAAIRAGLVAMLWLPAMGAQAFEYDMGDIGLVVNSRFTTGVTLRMQDRSNDLIGKTNIPGQSDLCTRDSCISLSGDPEPNQRLVNAAGAFQGVNADNGDLNYDKYDLTAVSNRLLVDGVLSYNDWRLRLRAIGYYDPINVGFDDKHNDTRFQPATTPRSREVERAYARGVALYDAYVSRTFSWGKGNEGAITVGSQIVRWGESTLIARNSLSEINSPSSIVLHTPGFEINEVFRPTPSIVLSSSLTSELSAELFYQLKWQEVEPDAQGTFFGDQDLINGTYADVTLGNFGEDPNHLQRVNGPIALISSSSLTVSLDSPHEPRDLGQFGAKLSYLAPFNGGTELNLYFLNYHSRYPYASAYAADESCTRKANTTGVGTATLNALIACRGFNGSLLGRSDQHNPEREPLPVDTFVPFLEYPEDIQMYGFSFNTTIGTISLAGEYSFRPNLPLQVHLNDVIFAALQPAFPANRMDVLPVDVSALAGLANSAGFFPALQDLAELGQSSFPSLEDAVPSYVAKYRGYGMVQAHQYIAGYERFPVGQLDLTAIKAFSSNPFGAEQIILIGELGFTQVFGMPDISVLQIEGGGANRTHASEGQDENISAPGERNYAHLNPHRQTEGFADSFAWGVRSLIRGEYNDVVFGWNFKPSIILQWDIKGIAPFPVQNFVEGRKQYDIGTDVEITQAVNVRVNYQIYTGGGRNNTLKDRDNFSLSASYSF